MIRFDPPFVRSDLARSDLTKGRGIIDRVRNCVKGWVGNLDRRGLCLRDQGSLNSLVLVIR